MRCDIKALGHYIGTWVSMRALVFFTRAIIPGPKPLPPLAGASLAFAERRLVAQNGRD